MRRIYQALIEKIYRWLVGAPDEDLEYGVCVCQHGRNTHYKGKYRCEACTPPDEKSDKEWQRHWLGCSCVYYIEKGRGDDPEPEIPTTDDLEKLFQK